MANRVLGNFPVPPGGWRYLALVLVLVALLAAALGVGAPHAASWAGLALATAVGMLAGFFLFRLWTEERFAAGSSHQIAAAAARANVAWAITTADGSVGDCNLAYRTMIGCAPDAVPAPPELALVQDASAAVLYRLSRKAAQGECGEESFELAPGLQLLAAVRPLKGGRTAWWFTPSLAAISTSAPVEAPTPSPPASLFADAPIGMAQASADGVIRASNAAFHSFFASAVDGRDLATLIEPADQGAVRALFAAALAGDARPAPTEIRVAGQHERMGELFACRQDEGQVTLYLIDISQQKALELRFAQSQKMEAVGQLAGGVAHDFNNHLTVIIGSSELLMMRHSAGDPSFNEINEIHQNALRAAALVSQLLAFSRKQTLQPKLLSLRDVLGEVAVMLRRLLREGIELKLEHGAELWSVHADETQISNAIINLVVNARDAMPKGGTVTIRTCNETVTKAVAMGTGVMPIGEYVRIDVADTGTGITPEHLGKIFDPFFTTKPTGQGTGLGLATVYGIVKQTGGFISVTSELGKGTCFRIFLPRFTGEAQAPAPAAAVPADVTGADTILLVEDEDAVRSFAARALRMRGYEVLEAMGGEEALEIVRKRAGVIHLLITDVVMPNMDGPTLVRTVKRLKPDIRVIFMSGYAEEAFRRNEENAANLHFLPKPFGLKQLAAKVKEVLSLPAQSELS